MPKLNKLQQDLFNRLSTGGDGRILIQYLEELCKECENARGKETMEIVRGGVIASDIIRREVIEKIMSFGQNNDIEINQDEFT